MPAHAALPFTNEDIPPSAEQTTEVFEVLRVAQIAGAALKALRNEHDISVEKASQWLHVSPMELARAESGNLIEVTRRGQLVDMASVLLMFMATILEQKKVRLPRPPR